MAAWRTPQMRAKDTDRTDTCQLLDSALADGQLSMEEHRNRVAAATAAATLGELQDLVSDLQLTTPPATVGPRGVRKGRWIVAAAVGGVLAAAIAGALVTFSGSHPARTQPSVAAPAKPEPAAAPTTASRPSAAPDDITPTVLNVPKQLQTLGGMTGLLDGMRKRFGDTIGIELAITPDEAMLYRPDPSDAKSKLLYHFSGGWGDPTRSPRDASDDAADLAAFDAKTVAGVLRTAPETLGIAADDVSEVVLDIDHIADADGPGALELLVKVGKKSGGDGYLYLDSAGNTKRVVYPS